jgi:hypothetical protein
MKGKKILLLFLALMLPACVFLFLKFFGKNQFDVPLLYQEGKIDAGNCEINYPTPYVLPDSFMNAFNNKEKASVLLLDFSDSKTNFDRVQQEFNEDQVAIKHISSLNNDLSKRNFIRDCIVLLKAPSNLVLIDSLKRIRGYYNSNNREDIDRLLLELNIILKNY